MEKYAVEIDPNKVEKEKTAGKATADNPNTNVPIDPEKGTLPFEKEPKENKE